MNNLSIAILLPCYNEAGAIGDTVRAFKQVLPSALIYVCDNNSTDNTREEALEAGAIVSEEYHQGKGAVIKRMFADIDADIFVMADGDNTYDAGALPELINALINRNLDMVVGTRSMTDNAYPTGHIFGNRAFSKLISVAFSAHLNDVFSGYRVMTRRFVKTLPLTSQGFEIETELTVHALHHRLPICEIATDYRARPEGTQSKLNTLRDGFKIAYFLVFLLRDVKPLPFFSLLGMGAGTLSLLAGIPVILAFLASGQVDRLPTAVLASALGVISVVCWFTALILDNVSRGRLETKLLHYLAHPSIHEVVTRAQPQVTSQEGAENTEHADNDDQLEPLSQHASNSPR